MYETSLVIGKFYPPTTGHFHLIKEASRQSKHLIVIVMGSTVESISVADRVKWIDEATKDKVTVMGITCESQVDYQSKIAWTQQVFAMKSMLKNTGYNYPRALFCSEGYGQELATALGTELVLVDPPRRKVPVSGTKVRENLGVYWNFLMPAAREGMALRAVFLGAESTGTTTLSKAIQDHYKWQHPDLTWVPEYGRQYTIDKLNELSLNNVDDYKWKRQDFIDISYKQRDMENEAAREGGRLLVCDTDALATDVFMGFYGCPGMGIARPEGNRVYFLTDHEGVPFQQDGYRKDDAWRRKRMTMDFAGRLNELKQPWTLVTGAHDQRMLTATRVIDRLLEKQATFADPIQEA